MSVEPFDYPLVASDRQQDDYDSIRLPAPAVTAFIGRTERGPINEPVSVRSFEEYRRRFGGYTPLSFVPDVVEQYFLHGGEMALIVRVANRATRASIDIPAGEEWLSLQAVQPGSREFLRVSIDYDRVASDALRFNLVVQRVSRPGSELIEDQELYTALSLNPADERYVIDALQDSELIRLAGPLPATRPDDTRATHPGQPIPYLAMRACGEDGDELTDYDVIGSNTRGTGLFALDRAERVDFICIPLPRERDFGTTSYVAAERYCGQRKALLIWDPPWTWQSAHAALAGMRDGPLVSHNALTYFPRLAPRDVARRHPLGVPACGAIGGLLARSARRGHWGPLSEADASLRPGLVPVEEVNGKESTLLKRFGINVFARNESGVCALHGNASMAGPTMVGHLWRRLDRRRLVLFMLATIERGTVWTHGSLRDPALVAKVERQVGEFLTALHEQGALAGRRPEQSFSIRIDPAFRGAAPFILRVGFALDAPGEFLVYEIRHDAHGSTTRAVPGLEVRELVG